MVSSSHATLLFYEGFSDTDYTEGALNGQPFVGEGYATGGSWNTASTFEAGGLSYPGLATTDGLRLSRSNGEVTANFNLSEDGPFGTAGILGSNGRIGGTDFTGPIYFSILANRNDTQGASFAGFNIYNDGAEGMGIGEVAGSSYSWLQSGSNGAIGDPATELVPDETRFFVFKLEYDAVDPMTARVWLDPDPTLGEDEQDASISTDPPNPAPADGFNSFRFRGTRVWEFDELRIGTTWEDVTPNTLAPAPLVITAVNYANGTATLTWSSTTGETYTVTGSTDLTNWDITLGTGIAASEGETTTQSFDLTVNPDTSGEPKLFFRIETTE